jgi:HD-GYP domain-containing protein (c-di-GMP phosphodiesterase class II)
VECLITTCPASTAGRPVRVAEPDHRLASRTNIPDATPPIPRLPTGAAGIMTPTDNNYSLTFAGTETTGLVGEVSGVAAKLAALQALGTRLIYVRDEQHLYEEMVEAAQRITGCDFCSLFTVDHDEHLLRLRAWSGYSDEVAGTRIPLDDGTSVQRQAFVEEYLVYVPEVFEGPYRDYLAPDLRSELAIPIVSKRGPVGVLDFGSRTPGAFTEQDAQFCSMLVGQMAFSLENNLLVRELMSTRDAVIHGMALLAESRDGHIGAHLRRICAMAEAMSQRLLQDTRYRREVDEEFVETISRSAALHDIGKVGIPDTILLKPGKLTASEYEVMKTHTRIGGDLLKELMSTHGSFFMLQMGADVAYGHHERWDGSGYPAGLGEDEIPLAARIVTICDFYDALASERIYKAPLSHEQVCIMVRGESGRHFDPQLVEVFHELAPAFEEIHLQNPD